MSVTKSVHMKLFKENWLLPVPLFPVKSTDVVVEFWGMTATTFCVLDLLLLCVVFW